ncbi:hypothetical protein EDD18DRAFT_1108020 [Armillaria luteobubalina]|uniref:Uncharacterized protein n=1 Tax=Armillaria luteobubalina TaxID=153913 RepID=A0AA39Q051_9AGAR|nr:hypothetical protein EDD18DRAFT_1108020 [Armillaria luteobubalina]
MSIQLYMRHSIESKCNESEEPIHSLVNEFEHFGEDRVPMAEYHPSSCHESKQELFEVYSVHEHFSEVDILFDSMLWYLYHSELDFELAETVLEAALNEVPEINVYYTPFLHLILYGMLRSYLDAKAVHLNDFILNHGPVMLSGKYSTVQGYPVIVRLGNLPAHIHNGQGVGGERVISWLPIYLMSLNIMAKLTLLTSRGLSSIKPLSLFFHPSRINQRPALGCNFLAPTLHLGMSFLQS